MKAAIAATRRRSNLIFLAVVLCATPAFASNQLILTHGEPTEKGTYLGVTDLLVDPKMDDARVWITVDGQKIAEGIRWPYRVIVDLGPTAVEHEISVTAIGPKKNRVQWHETVNKGHLPLTVHVTPVDLQSGTFLADTTAPKNDPVVAVELWHQGQKVVSVDERLELGDERR